MSMPQKFIPKRLTKPMVALLVLCLVVVGFVLYRVFTGPQGYVAQLHDAGGLRAGDDVKIAGIKVGKVSSVKAKGAVVVVDFNLNTDATLTVDTRTEVKLSSLLGERYLQLDLGDGAPLPDGGTLPVANAEDSYTLEKFWLDSSPVIGELDLPALSKAIEVLQESTGSSSSTKAALDGLTSVANIVNKRADLINQLVPATRRVTDEVVAQKDQLSNLITRGGRVFSLIAQRRDALTQLLTDGRRLVTELASMAKRNSAPMQAGLTQLKKILGVLESQQADLAETLRLANPAMRLYVNSAGDGPWVGVNAPGLILPDSWWCLQLNMDCR